MLSKLLSFGLSGLNGFLVNVEVDMRSGLPAIDIVGLGDTAVKESKQRVKSAIINSGFEFPIKKLIINLAPADIKKEGPLFDLPIALGILSNNNILPASQLENTIFLGELSLDGTIREVAGIMPMLISARKMGYKKFIIPSANKKEASYISDVQIYAVNNLTETVDFLNGVLNIEPIELSGFVEDNSICSYSYDFKDVKGQSSAKRALEIAAAGGHNVLMIGPPGSGKSMLAKCFPSIMPNMTFEEALEVTKIHSVAGELNNNEGIIKTRPFRSPHHTASTISLTGGNINSRPGEISLAHNGVLFLDELPEYSRNALESLRQPLEDGQITISRATQSITYPASFTLIASMNPCPCGNYGSKTKDCSCTPSQIHNYLHRISGPLMDRIDLHVEVDAISYDDLKTKSEGEDSLSIQKRVNIARQTQNKRFAKSKSYCNAKMSVRQIKEFCALDEESEQLLKLAFERLGLSARAHDRILKVARTIADIDNSENITMEHLAEAIQYRSLDKKYWG